MSVSNYIVIILVSLVVQLADGNQRIVYVSESISDNEDFFTSASRVSRSTDDEDFFTSGDVDGNLMCCVYGNCSCNSLDHALANLSSNVVINITTDMMLSSLINASNLVNVSIIGHNNPTVNCKRAGGIHFNFCHNCIIQDITWDGCGTETEAGIKLSDCSNIVIENCSFQYSKGPNIVLSGVSGHVNISYCNFVHNNHYGGHGAAIHYRSSSVTNDLLFLTISNCNFTDNKHAKSLVYIKNMKCKYISIITVQNITFFHNQGVSVYIVNQKIYLLETVVFKSNTARKGAGIYMKDHSTVILGKNSDVSFIQNTAVGSIGGAIYSRKGFISFEENSTTEFTNNTVGWYGGAIFSNDGSISFEENSTTKFTNNYARFSGGAIYSRKGSISFEENSTTKFTNNYARFSGGAIYSRKGSISFEENSTTEFTNNNAAWYGGAIDYQHGSISFEENSNTEFTNNHAAWCGGAINYQHGSISFEENSNTEFTVNFAGRYGGAIYSDNVTISFEDNSTTEFTNNTAKHRAGGAIYSYGGSISFEQNSTTEFTKNTAGTSGGAICSGGSTISFEENSMTDFTKNTAGTSGGAIHIYSAGNSISFEENSTTEITNNTATERGAMSSERSPITFKHISNTKFTNNFAIRDGGAIYSNDITVSSKGNSHIEFNNNVATRGGAIYIIDNFISFEGFSTTVFSNNIAKDYGGAITVEEESEIIFHNNSTVTFTHNNTLFGDTVYCGSNSIVTSKGNSTVIFNNVIPKWCINMICTPYTGQGAVTIDSNGIVMCSDQKAFTCLSESCNCKSLQHLLHGLHDGASNVVINLTDKTILSSVFQLRYLRNVSIIGENKLIF